MFLAAGAKNKVYSVGLAGVEKKKNGALRALFLAGNTKPVKTLPVGMFGATENTWRITRACFSASGTKLGKPILLVLLAGAAQNKRCITLPATSCLLQRAFMMHAQSIRQHACCSYHS